jgi:hypothetical protein
MSAIRDFSSVSAIPQQLPVVSSRELGGGLPILSLEILHLTEHQDKTSVKLKKSKN